METQDTTAHEHKPGHKITLQKLWNTLKHSTKKSYQTLGTGGLIALILGLILIAVIVSYERRFQKFERGVWYQPYYRVHTVMPRMFDDGGWMEDSWARIDREFRDMEKRHEKMMQALEKAPKSINDGEYTGYRTSNGKTIQYSLEIKENILNGTLLGTDTETLSHLRTELEKAGITITNTNGNIQFTAPKEKLETIVQIVNK